MTTNKQIYQHQCQICGEAVERCSSTGKFTCFECKRERNKYDAIRWREWCQKPFEISSNK